MKKFLGDNRLPIVISSAALIAAVVIGLVPVWQQSAGESPATADDLGDLAARVEALETALAAQQTAAPAATSDDSARFRQEIDLLSRGLLNQTGRVSRLKSAVEQITDDSGAPLVAQRTVDELALVNKALLNLTRRVNALEDQNDALAALPGDVTRLTLQMENVDSGLANLTRRLNAASDPLEQVSSMSADVARLSLQMQNVDSGLANLTRRINAASGSLDQVPSLSEDVARLAKQMAIANGAFLKVTRSLKSAAGERAALQSSVASLTEGGGGNASGTSGDTSGQLSEIEQKLDRILGVIGDG